MSKNLVIVESPAKAKTIEKYLGHDFVVRSSVGHIRSIAKKSKDGKPPIDTATDFAVIYETNREKAKVISELKKQVKAVGKENVWLATDEDREGEAIAWHLCEVLKLDLKTTKRIAFHEITKDAITHAIAHPRTINMSLVEAQQARQILDRLVGFELSPVVWRKVPGGKSAGRVQSPAVRLLVEKEREIEAFTSNDSYQVNAIFEVDNHEFKAELSERFATETEAYNFLESLKDSKFTISAITKSPSTRKPAAPFTTSTLQQTASSSLRFSSKATMASAQRLYQDGKITYMRTDSVNLSSQAIAAAADLIKRLYGPKYSQVRNFKTSSKGAQEAHEAIRPTDLSRESVSDSDRDQKLYDLIRRRTLASQMTEAKLENTTVTITISNQKQQFTAKGQVIVFDGFLRVYGTNKEEILPDITKGQSLRASEITAKQIFAKPPARYSEGALVKKLEELGIGRPSTYATIIDTIQTRGYAEAGDSEGTPRNIILLTLSDGDITKETIEEKSGSTRGKLLPTPAGELIADFLIDYFSDVVDYRFTANVENDFDQIAQDELAKTAMLRQFYDPFHQLIDSADSIARSSVGASREVGTDPKSGQPITARMGRFGPMLQLGSTDGDQKPRFAPIPKNTTIGNVTLEQAIHAFELPRLVGKTTDGQDIKANIGRFGPYIQVGKLFVSIKPDSPYDITLDKALELYQAKLQAEAEKNIKDFGDGIKILNGRFGPYITDGTKNAKIPKDTEPSSIEHEQAVAMLAKAPTKKARRVAKKGTKTRRK